MSKYTKTYTCNKCKNKRETKFPKIETSEDSYCPICNECLLKEDITITKKKKAKVKPKKCPKEGNKCKVCKNGKVIHNLSKEVKGPNKALCTNPKCTRYFICSCGKPFGTHYQK